MRFALCKSVTAQLGLPYLVGGCHLSYSNGQMISLWLQWGQAFYSGWRIISPWHNLSDMILYVLNDDYIT